MNEVATPGEKNVAAKLTEEMVRAIRNKHRLGIKTKEVTNQIETEFGVKISTSCVRGIVSGRRWGHLK